MTKQISRMVSHIELEMGRCPQALVVAIMNSLVTRLNCEQYDTFVRADQGMTIFTVTEPW